MTAINPNLPEQFGRARPILFTGAGFSLSAKNILGEQVPTVGDLKAKIWELCFPGTPVENESTLQHVYESAILQRRKDLKELLTASFTVDADSTPDWYASLFGLPWHKCYTLNIDDLGHAVNRRHKMPRKIVELSAARHEAQNRQSDRDSLKLVHLNGDLEDLPDHVTFSVSQYVERLVSDEPFYAELVSELLSHPFVFIGTKLDEPPLWQHVELRFLRGGKIRELRPRSYLVTPHLDKARQSVLANYNVEWLEMTAEEFAKALLSVLDTNAGKGFSEISKRLVSSLRTPVTIHDVSDLAITPNEKTEFLLGEEPRWADIQSGRAVGRTADLTLWDNAEEILSSKAGGLLVITGTAGSGKSTALMRIALHLSVNGQTVGWIDRDTECSLRDIRQYSNQDDAPRILAIDDADNYGSEFSAVVREILAAGRTKLVMAAVRSGRIDRVLNPSQLKNVARREVVMPPLVDEDIDALIDVLTSEKRLGRLQGLSRDEQRKLFTEQSGRELLVAMIQATSGKRFEDKASEEFFDLAPDARRLYGLIAVASSFQFSLSKSELLVGVGCADNKILNELDQMVRRHIVTTVTGDLSSFRARHRVIAEIIFGRLQSQGLLFEILRGLALIAATQVNPQMHRSARPRRLLVKIINHDFLHRALGPEQTPNLYGDLEHLLPMESHYWLQRGSFELEFGNLRLAENFLNQAKGLAPDDPYVENEYAYLLFRKALENTSAMNAPELVAEGTAMLEANIARKGDVDGHPYHILGSQGLAWSRRGLHKFEDKRNYLESLRKMLEDGSKKHPMNKELKSLFDGVTAEYLNLALRA